MRRVIERHAVVGEPYDPGKLAAELEEIADTCTAAERRYLEGLGAAMLEALIRLDQVADDGSVL